MTVEEVLKKVEFEEKWLLNAGYNAYNIDIAFHTIKWTIKQLSTESENVGICQQEVGTMSGKVTNGDMIKALFPDIELEHIEDIINVYCLCEHSVTFDTEWWNSPYRAESEEE